MKAKLMIDSEYSNTLLISLEAEGEVESLLFDFLKNARVERDSDLGTLTVRLTDAE